MKQTPEQRAEARYKMDHYTHQMQREAYATCVREEVEPLEAEVERLRALVQELVDGLHSEVDMMCDCDYCAKGLNAMEAAKQQGFVPTNTEDNG